MILCLYITGHTYEWNQMHNEKEYTVIKVFITHVCCENRKSSMPYPLIANFSLTYKGKKQIYQSCLNFMQSYSSLAMYLMHFQCAFELNHLLLCYLHEIPILSNDAKNLKTCNQDNHSLITISTEQKIKF